MATTKNEFQELLKDDFFGKPISKGCANEMIDDGMKIKKHFIDKLVDITQGNEVIHKRGRRFYCCKDAMFFFHKKKLQELLDSMKDDGCAVIYYSSREDEHDKQRPKGRPTLVVCAYEFKDDGNLHLIEHPFKSPANADKVALEHPGGNGRLLPRDKDEDDKKADFKYHIRQRIPMSEIFDFVNEKTNKCDY